MHRFRAGLLARRDDLVGNQIRLRGRGRANMHGFIRHLHERRPRIGIGIDRHRLDTHPTRRLDHTAGNFTTVGDEDFLEHSDILGEFGERIGALYCKFCQAIDVKHLI